MQAEPLIHVFLFPPIDIDDHTYIVALQKKNLNHHFHENYGLSLFGTPEHFVACMRTGT